jgi:SulP family sulfate permease
VGSTLIEVLDEYAEDLLQLGGRLYLSGVHPDVARQLRRTGKLEADRDVWIVPAGEGLGASTKEAVAQGNAWLGRNR